MSSAQTELGIYFPFLSQMLLSFIRRMSSVVDPQHPLENPIISLSFQKSCPFCMGGKKRMIHCLESEFV